MARSRSSGDDSEMTRAGLSLSLLLVACDAGSPRAALDAGEDGGAVVVVPGRRIGPLQVGMDRGALSRQRLPLTLLDGGVRHVMAGAMELWFDPRGRVERIRLAMRRAPEGVRLGGAIIPPRADLERIVSIAPGCTPAVDRAGVATWRCAGGGLLIERAGDALSISVARPLDAGAGP